MDDWIRVEDDVPGHGLGSYHVLTYRPEAPVHERVATTYYDATMCRWGGAYPVTHWMHKPEGPKQ